MYFVDWYEQCGTVVAWYEQHGVNLCLCFVFRGSYGKKIEFWYDQCSHGQTAFCSYVLGQIASYLQKVICGEEVQFWSIKTCIPCIFYSCSNFYLKKREGGFLVTTICPLATKIYTWLPVGARIKKLISDPVYWFRLSVLHKTQVAMQFPAKITLSCIWVAIHVDWVISHWYACGADRRWASRRSCDYQNFSDG